MDLSGLQETISTRGKIFPARSRMVGSVSGKSIMVPRIRPLGGRANRAHRITNPARRGKAQKGGWGQSVCRFETISVAKGVNFREDATHRCSDGLAPAAAPFFRLAVND